MTASPYTPDVAAIATDLTDDHIHIDPAFASQIAPEQLAAITASIEASPIPIYVLAAPLTREGISPIQLASLVHRELPEDGIWYVAQQRYGEKWTLQATTYGVSTRNAPALAGYVAEDLYPTELGLQLQKATELISSGTAEEVYYATLGKDTEARPSTRQDDGGAQVFGIDAPIAYTGIGVLALIVAVVALRRRPHSRHEIVVKDRALRRISTAQSQSWRSRAVQETAALGDRINDLQIADDADRGAWTAALDHYEAANRVLDRTTAAAHSIGALVLARRGEDALDHAVAGRAWAPTAVCFFNPLHGPSTTTARWQTPAGARDVPACQACRRVVGKKKEPDFLDLPIGDTVVHYVDADAEPWASTGYGSLDPDLLARVSEL